MLRINKKVWLRISLLLFLVIGMYYFAFYKPSPLSGS